MSIIKPNELEFNQLVEWLKHEYETDGEGFYCNIGVIKNSYNNEELFALSDTGKIVAFAVVNYRFDPEIISVKKNLRHMGYGAKLAKFCEEQAKQNGKTAVLEIECAPSASIPFWQKMGFTLHKDGYHAYKILPKKNELSAAMPPANVQVNVYRENALYSQQNKQDYLIGNFYPSAIYTDDSTVAFHDRFISYVPELPNGTDLAIEILLEGKPIYFDKAKRSKGKALGIFHPDHNQLYIDILNLAEAANAE